MVHARAARVVGDPARRAAPAPCARRRDRPARGSASRRDRTRARAHRTSEPRHRAREPSAARARCRARRCCASRCGVLSTMSLDGSAVDVRPMRADDLDAADHVMRLAFGTIRGLPDPSAAFGDADSVRTRFRAAPEYAWVAEHRRRRRRVGLRSALGLVRLPRPAQRPSRPLGSRHRGPAAPARPRGIRELGRPSSGALHLRGQPQAPRPVPEAWFLAGISTVVTAKEVGPTGTRPHALFSDEPKDRHDPVLDEIRALTDEIFDGLDLGREILAVNAQGIGDTVLAAQRRDVGGDGRVSLRRRERGGQ